MRNTAHLILCIGMASATVALAPRVASAQGILDCRDIDLYHIDQQENLLAGQKMIACGRADPGSGEADGSFTDDYGGTDIDVITGNETYSGSYTFFALLRWA